MVGSGDDAGQLLVPGRPTTLEYSRAGACSACSRCGTDGLFLVCVFFFLLLFFFFCFVFFVLSSRISYFPFLMPHLLGDGWTF